MTTITRPLTSRLSDSILAVVRCYSPALAGEHLAHAWDALEAARKGEKVERNMAYARNRLACLRSEPVVRSVKARDRKAFEAEVAELEAALSASLYEVEAVGCEGQRVVVEVWARSEAEAMRLAEETADETIKAASAALAA